MTRHQSGSMLRREEAFFRCVFLAIIANGVDRLPASSLRDPRNAAPLRARYDLWAGNARSEDQEELLCALHIDPLTGSCGALERASAWLVSTNLWRSDDGLETFEPTISKKLAESWLEEIDHHEQTMLRDIARIIAG